jgi:Flp pilus assembly protein TadB
VQTITQQHDAELKTITQEQKDEIVQNQSEIIERTKATIEQIISMQLQEERKKREQEIREEEALRPAREATQTAMGRVVTLEKKLRSHQRLKRGLFALGWVLLVVFAVIQLFLPLPQWSTVVAIAVIAPMLVIATLWRKSCSASARNCVVSDRKR